MRRTRLWLLLGVVGGIGGCVESAGPPAPRVSNRGGGPQVLGWAAGTHKVFAIRPAARGGPIDVAPVAPSPLSANQLSFWAYRDRDASVAVDYQASDGTWRPYVTLSVPRGALLHRPDGTLFASGDSVEITLSLDTTALALELEPTGLGFDPLVPAQLKIWYSAAGPDLDGDGSVNSVDAYIEEVLLGLWTREQLTDPWSALSAIKTASAKVLSADLAHFSGYEVAW